MASPKTKTMSDEHKAALAEGREQGRKVRAYLEALADSQPKRGRKRTVETVKDRLTNVEADLEDDISPVERLQLLQERIDLTAELERLTKTTHDEDAEILTDEFVEVAKAYSDRKGLSKAAWREVGVPPAVLKQAGIR